MAEARALSMCRAVMRALSTADRVMFLPLRLLGVVSVMLAWIVL